MSNSLSPNRQVAQSLRNIIENDRISNNELLAKVFEIIQEFLNNFDDCCSKLEQQDYINKCEKDIVAVIQQRELSAVSMNTIRTEINQSFEQIENCVESMKTNELKDFDELITALADLKQSIDKSFSHLISELNNMKRNMNDVANKVSKLEVESEAVKTMNFISDLFKPVVAKLQLLLLEKNLSVTTLTKSRLEQVKRFFIQCSKEKYDEELCFIAEIIEKVSDEYHLGPLVTIDYLIKKKNRNEMMHYSRKIKEYALSTNSGDWNLIEFLSNQPELENHLFISEVNALNGLFFACANN